jgi:hypothetical protein
MAARSTLRWFLWLSCVLAVVFGTRSAEAYAPMCDARGISIDAPPPATPIRDARIEAVSGPVCHDPTAMLGVGHRVRRGATVVDDGPTMDGWMRTVHHAPLPQRHGVRAPEWVALGLGKAPGHAAGVFRPPRRT